MLGKWSTDVGRFDPMKEMGLTIEQAQKKAIQILRAERMNEKIINQEIGYDEFVGEVLRHPEEVKQWSEKYGLSDENSAWNFATYLTTD